MTTKQPSRGNSKDLPPPTVNKIDEKKRFTNFYLAMLVLSTVGTAMASLGVFGIPELIQMFTVDPTYVILNFAGYAVTLVSIIALVLLWRKDINGLYLKLGTYVANFLLNVGLIFVGGGAADRAINTTLEELRKQGSVVDENLVSTITSATLMAALIFGLIVSVVFGLLWWFAWKNQAKADAEG